MEHAFATTVMLGDAYVPGALVLAFSLRAVGSKASLVVLVTEDVTEEAKEMLQTVFDEVVPVNLITAKAIQSKWKKAGNKYDWIDHSFTKVVNVLSLTQYSKVCLLDADTLAVNNPDELFDLSAPAGICSSIRAFEQIRYHGKRLQPSEIDRAIKQWGMRGCLYLVEPNKKDFKAMKNMLEERRFYGDEYFYLGADERLMTEYFKHYWTHVHSRFGINSWKTAKMPDDLPPMLLHYVMEKPWAPQSNWPDYEYWYNFAALLLQKFPKLKDVFSKLERVTEIMQEFEANKKKLEGHDLFEQLRGKIEAEIDTLEPHSMIMKKKKT